MVEAVRYRPLGHPPHTRNAVGPVAGGKHAEANLEAYRKSVGEGQENALEGTICACDLRAAHGTKQLCKAFCSADSISRSVHCDYRSPLSFDQTRNCLDSYQR